MNALTPHTQPTTLPDATRAARLVTRVSAIYVLLALGILALDGLAMARPDARLADFSAAAILIPLAGLLATRPLTIARARLNSYVIPPARPSNAWSRRLRRLTLRRSIEPELHLSRLARRPQGIIVPLIGLCSMAAIYLCEHRAPGPVPNALVLGGAAIGLGLPLLLVERIVNSMPRASLLEAPGIRALLFVPALTIPLFGLLLIGSALGLPWMQAGMTLLSLYVGLVAAELSVRALANWFLPPPAPDTARAAVNSATALLLQPGRLLRDGPANPLRTYLGLDFSRSWALRYTRSAALPIGLALGLIAWALTGVTLVEFDKRAVYERFGKPVAVWQAGAHVGLPWPLGRVRRVDLGIIHAVLLGGEPPADARSPAEADAPASADRLWNQVHPSEVSYLLASREADGRQGFQTISVDLKVLWRTGLDDASALKAAYAVTSPDALVRAEAGRLVASVFAGQVIAEALGDGREGFATTLRTRLQAELDSLGSGIELADIVIEAIHPPPGAAEAYQNVQAAQIVADTAISTERGRALANDARARQEASDMTLTAQGFAAETVGLADVYARNFTADVAAAQTDRNAFLLERYFASLATALAKSPLVVVDNRLTGTDAPSIDLRSFGAPPTKQAGDD